MEGDSKISESRGGGDGERATEGDKDVRSRHRRRRRAVVFLCVLAILVVFVVIGRTVLPSIARGYAIRALERNRLYEGKIGKVYIDIWRGAYSVEDVRVSKAIGNIPVPLFKARRIDFAIQWKALLHRKVVGSVVMEEPEVNFVDGPSDAEDQTGLTAAGGPWSSIIGGGFPVRINRAVIKQGSVHFRVYETETPVDLYVSEIEAVIDNLSNIRDEPKPLVSTVQATGLVMDHAELELKMAFDPFSYRPTFQMAARLLGLDVVELNDLAKAYGNFDFESGRFDFVVEADAKNGLLSGYAKPLFRDLRVFSLSGDSTDGERAIDAFWEALLGTTTSVLKNRAREQFGTLIPFSGDLSGTTTADMLATIGNILRNAFIRAYLPRLEGGQEIIEGLKFGPPELTDPIGIGDPN